MDTVCVSIVYIFDIKGACRAVAIAGATIPLSFHVLKLIHVLMLIYIIKSLQRIWRSGTRR